MTISLIAFILASVLVTSFISGIVGMAGGMILMGLFTWQLPVAPAMILHGVSQFFANISRAIVHRQHVRKTTILPYMAGMAVIFVLFCILRFVTSDILIYTLMGASPFAAFALRGRIALEFSKPPHAFVCGLLVSFFQLTSGTGGPLLDIFFQSRNMTRHETVATKSFAMSSSHLIKLAYFGLIVSSPGQGMKDIPLLLCLAIIPTAMLGTHLGKYVLERLEDKHFYRITQSLLLFIGAIYLIRAAMLAF